MVLLFYGNADIITLNLRRLHVAGMGDGRRAHKILLGNLEGTRPRGRLKIRWEVNIIRDLKEVDYKSDWKTLAEYRRHDVLLSWRQRTFEFHNASTFVSLWYLFYSDFKAQNIVMCENREHYAATSPTIL